MKELHTLLLERKEPLILLESCTGGLLSAKLTQYAGASEYLLGSLVVYSNELKKKFLGVQENTLATYGAVSYQVVEEMIEGAFAKTTARHAIAVSGIMGPSGGSPEKPIGTVWAAIAERGEEIHSGLVPLSTGQSRIHNIEETSTYLLQALWRKFASGVIPFT